jgi:hypothetical protein
MSLRAWSIVGLLVVGVAPLACASDDERKPPPASAGSAPQPGAGGADVSEAGSAGHAESGGAPSPGNGGEGGAFDPGLGGSLTIGGAPVYDDPLCDRAASWTGDTALPNVSTPEADERLLAMTHDALTLVFSRDDALLVADRKTTTADFDAPVAVTLPEPYTHARGIALQDDGLGMIVVDAEGKLFADVPRVARSGTFAGEPDSARFAAVAENTALHKGTLSSPVLAPDGSLYFTEIGPSSSRVLHSHLAAGDQYFEVQDQAEDIAVLGGKDGKSKLTQSVSSDERTLFFFDEALGHSVGVWNSVPGETFTLVAEFPDLESVFSTAACAQLYGTRELAGSLDVVLLAPK